MFDQGSGVILYGDDLISGIPDSTEGNVRKILLYIQDLDLDTYFTIQEPNLNPLSIVFIPGINNRNGTLKRNRDVFHKETYL